VAAVRSIFGRFFGNAVSTSAGVGIGGAVQNTLNPLTQDLANETWSLHAVVPPDPYALANGVAQGQVGETVAREWAKQSGIGDAQFTALVNIANTGPGAANALAWWRRGIINDAGLKRALKRAAWEDEWINDLIAAKNVLLSPAELANARQQGFVDAARQHEESVQQGVNAERADILFELSGLPPGAATAQEYLNRGLIDATTFAQMIREGHTKTKYIDVLRRGAEYVLSPINYVEGRLRGWLTDAEMYAGTSLHGVTKADTDLLFEIHGRPISFHQVWIGLQRGGTLDGPTDQIHPAFLASLRRSNIQPSFYNLAWAQRYTYPSAFVMRALTQTGVLTAAETEADLVDMGWRPDRAKQVAAAWAGGGGTTADAHVTKAQTQLWSRTHSSYISDETDDAQATAALTAAGVAPAAIQPVLTLWRAEKALIRKQLSPADLRKAYRKQDVNVATGLAWSREDALARLLELGYDQEDAENYLNIG
jgi:hypothetical protein